MTVIAAEAKGIDSAEALRKEMQTLSADALSQQKLTAEEKDRCLALPKAARPNGSGEWWRDTELSTLAAEFAQVSTEAVSMAGTQVPALRFAEVRERRGQIAADFLARLDDLKREQSAKEERSRSQKTAEANQLKAWMAADPEFSTLVSLWASVKARCDVSREQYGDAQLLLPHLRGALKVVLDLRNRAAETPLYLNAAVEAYGAIFNVPTEEGAPGYPGRFLREIKFRGVK